ncbi:thioesterase II family protein [Cellulosilyticum ruminicola]|uniref:thioesterase II family protein n=1 Tax=Cellulosilyticum ruminicola TaxID=425254 RepID=UPI0006D242DB|nr:thioesterase domain-containing protein [Cellulosilyticum ruminicola]
MGEIIKSKWITHDVQNKNAEINFICFPYAGGSPSLFAPWKSEIPETINFFPILYPQRELRKNDPMPENVDILVSNFVEENIELFSKDFILFGHCTGTLIAYKVLLEVRTRLGKEPIAFIASGSESPRYVMTREREMGKEALEDKMLIKRMVEYELVDEKTAMGPIFSKYYLPIYRADLSMLSTYEYEAEEVLKCPIYVLWGNTDLTLRDSALKDWKQFSNEQVTFKQFTGKHFYFAQDKKPLLDYLNNILGSMQVVAV